MNGDAMHKIVRLTEEELQELTREVKETIAYPQAAFKKPPKTFTAAQLWYRRQKMRSASRWIRK